MGVSSPDKVNTWLCVIACFNPGPQSTESHFYALGSGWKHAITQNLKPAGDPGRVRVWFWKAAFPQVDLAISERTWVSPAGPKTGQTGHLGSPL